MAEVDVMSFVVRCSALLFRGDTVLVVERVREGRQDWVLPGGNPRPGESIGSCVRREVEEETGLRVNASRIAFILEANDYEQRHTLDIVFACTEDGRSEPQVIEHGLKPTFVSAEQLGALNLRPPIAGHIKGIAASPLMRTAAYLGNMWRP
jgi:ADP-ribose pyrophosphatase YjhB (NUDIX family)